MSMFAMLLQIQHGGDWLGVTGLVFPKWETFSFGKEVHGFWRMTSDSVLTLCCYGECTVSTIWRLTHTLKGMQVFSYLSQFLSTGFGKYYNAISGAVEIVDPNCTWLVVIIQREYT